MSSPAPLARLVRSGIPESIHHGSVVVADAAGRVRSAVGVPDRVTLLRSTAKPFQAAVSLRRMDLALPDEEVAIMAASHNAEPPHLAAVRALLDRAGLTEAALRCPPGRPLDPDPARRAVPPERILHNCSGKHAGMLLACVRRGDDPESYLDSAHPLQTEIRELIQRAGGTPQEAEAIDGCGAPVGALALGHLAAAYARLAEPTALGEHAPVAERVADAMRAAPAMVAGRGRVCTALMRSAPGVLAKVGAEGVAAAALLHRGLGVAVRIEDGAARARDAVLVHALDLLEVVDASDPSLSGFHRPAALGGGSVVGRLEVSFTLGTI